MLYLYQACTFYQNHLFKIILHTNKYHFDDLGCLRYDTMSIASQYFEVLKLQETFIQWHSIIFQKTGTLSNHTNTEGIVHIQCNVFLWHFNPILGHGLPFRGFVITLIGHTTLSRTPLDKWSAQHRGLYLIEHKHSQQMNILAPSVIQTHNPSRRVATDLCLRLQGHCDQHLVYQQFKTVSLNYIIK